MFIYIRLLPWQSILVVRPTCRMHAAEQNAKCAMMMMMMMMMIEEAQHMALQSSSVKREINGS